MIGALRRAILSSGAEFAREGELAAADDLLYLTLAELRSFARREPRDWGALIRGRRAAGEREKGRRQIPRVLLSDGRCFYEGMRGAGEEGVIQGALVCPGTDPSWTPLFLTAGGLVMEVGGMMTHGAVVAREYGIPAVVGVHEACTRLATGRRIRVDGSTGKVTLLGAAPMTPPSFSESLPATLR